MKNSIYSLLALAALAAFVAMPQAEAKGIHVNPAHQRAVACNVCDHGHKDAKKKHDKRHLKHVQVCRHENKHREPGHRR